MGVTREDILKLREPFHPRDIEWRIQSARRGKHGIWAQVLAYVDSRAIQNRLDEVIGPENWQVYQGLTEHGAVTSLSIKIGDEWITKSDGAGFTDVEGTKGSLSGGLKRAGVLFGMGRYLYDLKQNYAIVYDDGRFSGKTSEKGKPPEWFNWSPPALPAWALPQGVPTLDEVLNTLRDRYRDGIDPSLRIKVGREWTSVVDFLAQMTDDHKSDYLLLLDILDLTA